MSAGEPLGSGKENELDARCRTAEDLANTAGPREAETALLDLARRFPEAPEPRMSLARLYRWLGVGRHGHALVEGPQLQKALKHARAAVDAQEPAMFEALELLSEIMHSLAMHSERAAFFTRIGRKHPDVQVRFTSLCWAAVALQCRAVELTAQGLGAGAHDADRKAVHLHREALETWPDAPVAVVLESYFGESHIVQAYANSGEAKRWIESVEDLLHCAEGKRLPLSVRTVHLSRASDLASQAGLPEEAVRLASAALAEFEAQEDTKAQRLQAVRLKGSLLRATAGSGDVEAAQIVGSELEAILEQWAELPAEELKREPQDASLAAGYNDAARTFVVAHDWERAIRVAKRAIELWDFGPNHWFLAVALWAGRRDRRGALQALRNAARDTRLSGKGECRDLRDDFLTSLEFADVRDDPEFLAAVAVEGVVE